MATAAATINGQKGYNGGWETSFVTNNDAYIGYNATNDAYYSVVMKITLPSFYGQSVSLKITHQVKKSGSGYKGSNLRWALSTKADSATMNKYTWTNGEVTDSGQIASGIKDYSDVGTSYGNWNITINSTALTSGGTYYLYIWSGDTDHSYSHFVTLNTSANSSATLTYNDGVVHINTTGTSSGWATAICWINTDGTASGWKRALPWVNTDGTSSGWKLTK